MHCLKFGSYSIEIQPKILIFNVLILILTLSIEAQNAKPEVAGFPIPQIQFPQITTPHAPTLQEMVMESQQRVQQQNNAIIQADMLQYEQRQQQAKGIIDEASREFQTVSYEFPDNSHFHATKYFSCCKC